MHLKFLSLLLLSTTALATLHQESHWAINTYNTAPKEERDDCSARGAFYVKGANGKQCCSSEKTRVPPKSGTHCPKEWAQHKRTGICVPPKPSYTCDCREGYSWNGNSWKCEKNTSPKYWQWDKRSNKCVPTNCEAPEPDCDNWDEGGQCCQAHPAPSPKPAPPGKGYGGGYGYGGYKRDLRKERDGVDGRQVERESRAKARLNAGQVALYRDEVDDTFCPAPLKACAVKGNYFATRLNGHTSASTPTVR
ncbi:hypothetical protein QFC20_006304 [Naganishia adeliensis]|uniref:Uncharacterized protein n=1 Tax=Naganishia adeliensis TaxID=92952 RepID=A0ACC2VDE2_9TREE|nr:hypothetical protein QFC20_006304 [Naganishia adeliensis]